MLPPKELVLFKNGNAEKCLKMPKICLCKLQLHMKQIK